ncbi:MAG: hypothetical protein EF813_03190 [Methanosarcinales archaeon]|nr:MAG: hypothetical protein EF813_03190 [Methanosarcinales archaeon]
MVYDPEGSRATGEGWFDPAGESEKADFEFTAKYKNDVSTGYLGFKDNDAEIKLKSTSIDWLVISAASAQFQGTGTIKGDEGLCTPSGCRWRTTAITSEAKEEKTLLCYKTSILW